MEGMLYSLENRIVRQMFKLIVEPAKLCRILFDHLELDLDDFDELHERCVKEAKHLNGAIKFPSSMRGKKLAELDKEDRKNGKEQKERKIISYHANYLFIRLEGIRTKICDP